MASYVFILLGLLVALFYLVLTQPARKSAALLVNGAPFLLIIAGALLTLFRRGPLGIPLIFFGIMLWRRTRVLRPISPPGGRKSKVRSSHLEMELDHDTGELDGHVLTGPLRNSRLSSLGEDELFALYREIQEDLESVALLESFLERYHPGWRDRVQSPSSGWNGATDGGPMTKQEARQVLGVTADASREEILEAWRRLIKRVHPDSGGSAFLTAKINGAKSVLLDE